MTHITAMNEHPSDACRARLVCLACFEDRLASLLETARCLRLYRLHEAGAEYAGDCPLPVEGLPGLPGALRRAGVSRLVCGGATCRCVEMFAAAGIRLDPWIAGRVDEVLAALVQGRVHSLRAPGQCPGRGMGRGRRGC